MDRRSLLDETHRGNTFPCPVSRCYQRETIRFLQAVSSLYTSTHQIQGNADRKSKPDRSLHQLALAFVSPTEILQIPIVSRSGHVLRTSLSSNLHLPFFPLATPSRLLLCGRVATRSSHSSRQPCISTNESGTHVIIRSGPRRIVGDSITACSSFVSDVFGHRDVEVRECCAKSQEEDEGYRSAGAREDRHVHLRLKISAPEDNSINDPT